MPIANMTIIMTPIAMSSQYQMGNGSMLQKPSKIINFIF